MIEYVKLFNKNLIILIMITVKAFVVTPHEMCEILVINLFWDDFYCPVHKLIKIVF